MKKLKLSGFDLGVIIAFAVITLLGGGAWWYLSGQLQAAQSDVKSAETEFVRYSVAKAGPDNIVVSPSNGKNLQANIELIKAQIDLLNTKLQPKENKLSSIDKEDPVEWKHDLDDEVHRLNAAAKVHGVIVPPNFYFGFSRYLSQSPNDEQTLVLKKQLVGVEELANILINAPVKEIRAVRRSYEEDPHAVGGAAPGSGAAPEADHLSSYALNAPANAYIAYPFEVEFETTSENFRPIINSLIQSPYLFVVRTLSVENSKLNSPMISELANLAGPPAGSVVGTAPGEVAATTTTKGPQFLFGDSTLKIKVRIDMIEWKAGNK
jgi:hypothetical protein